MIALDLLARAEAHAVDDLQRARVGMLRGRVEWASVTGREAPVLLMQAAPQPAGGPRPGDLLLDGLTTMIVQGRAAAEPAMRRAVTAFLDDQVSGEDRLKWGFSPRWRPWACGISTAGTR